MLEIARWWIVVWKINYVSGDETDDVEYYTQYIVYFAIILSCDQESMQCMCTKKIVNTIYIRNCLKVEYKTICPVLIYVNL